MRRSDPQLRALPQGAVAVMESLAQHRLLSTRQVRALHLPDRRAARTRELLGALYRAGLIDWAREAHGGKLWFLTRQGTDAVQVLFTHEPRRLRAVSLAQAAGPLRAHTLAVNDVGVCFVAAARAREDECGPLAWRHEVAHPTGPPSARRPPELVIADALLTYTRLMAGGALRTDQAFIELDRATTTFQALAEKLSRYRRLHDHTPGHSEYGGSQPAWRDHYQRFPTVLIVLSHRDERLLERRMRRIVAHYQAEAQLHVLPVALVLHRQLIEHGPFAPIFIDPRQGEHYVNWLREPPATTKESR